jgi:NADPH:quinone reductase-like Zn-dependent oxidoreductase
MQKIVIHRPGGYSALKLEDHPDLTPGDDQVVVAIAASGVNYADCCVRWGVYESARKLVGWPITPGFEFAGTVKLVGKNVTRWQVGDPVFGISFFGAYATEVAVPERHLFPIPAGFTMEQAAGFPAVHLTAYHALFQLVHLPSQARVLVHSAGGGVGSALVQLGRSAGFQVAAVVGSTHKVSYVRSLGADLVVDKSSEPLWQRVKDWAPQGFDAVLDANGPATLADGYRALRPTGKLIAYGSHTLLPQSDTGRMNYLKAVWGLMRMPRFNPNRLISDNKSIIGFNLSFLFDRDDLVTEAMAALLDLVQNGRIQPPRVTSFPLAQVGEAHRLIESGQSTGKLILTT